MAIDISNCEPLPPHDTITYCRQAALWADYLKTEQTLADTTGLCRLVLLVDENNARHWELMKPRTRVSRVGAQ